MQVVALKPGFYGGERKRVGDIFEMEDRFIKKDASGKTVRPKWVKPAPDIAVAKREAAAAKQAEADRLRDGAIAAAGGKGAKAAKDAKATNLRDLVG